MRLSNFPLALRPMIILATVFVLLSWIIQPAALASQGRLPSQSIDAGHMSASKVPLAPVSADSLTLNLVKLTPSNVTPEATIEATVSITNTSSTPIEGASLRLSLLRSRLTSRADLHEWSARETSNVEDLGTALAASAPVTIAPGAQTEFTVTLPASDLTLTHDPTLWGPRRIALSLVSDASPAPAEESETTSAIASTGGNPLAALHTFIVWNPSADLLPEPLRYTYLTPVSAADPAETAVDPQAAKASVSKGQLSERLTLAQHEDVSWWLDPSLVDPVALPQESSLIDAAHAMLSQPHTLDDQAAKAGGSTVVASDAGGDPQATEASTPAGQASAPEPTTPESSPSTSPSSSQWSQSAWWKKFQKAVTTASANHSVVTSTYAHAQENQASDEAADILTERSVSALETAGITYEGTLVRVPASHVSSELIKGVRADAVLVPAESMWSSPSPIVTSSGYGQLETQNGTQALLGYDSTLTYLAEQLATSDDPDLLIRQAVAESALVAGQDTDATRHLLIAPSALAQLDASTSGQLLDELAAAPWAESRPVADLLAYARNGSGTTALRGTDDLLWTGPSTELQATQVNESGSTTIIETVPSSVDSHKTGELSDVIEEISGLSSAMEDPHLATMALILAASGLNGSLQDSKNWAVRVDDAKVVTQALNSRITLSMSTTYNLVSSGAGVPISIRNDLDTTVTLIPDARVSSRIVRVNDDIEPITIAPHSSVDVSIPIEAIASGTVEFHATVRTPSGFTLESGKSELTVNPEWENWTTMILMVGMGLLVIVGVIRAGRTKSEARAPAVKGPENLSDLDHPREK